MLSIPPRSTTGLYQALAWATIERQRSALAHRSRPGANLLDAHRITRQLKNAGRK